MLQAWLCLTPWCQDIGAIFEYYDRSGDGRIDYKEFSNILATGSAQPKQSLAQEAQQFKQLQGSIETGGAR